MVSDGVDGSMLKARSGSFSRSQKNKAISSAPSYQQKQRSSSGANWPAALDGKQPFPSAAELALSTLSGHSAGEKQPLQFIRLPVQGSGELTRTFPNRRGPVLVAVAIAIGALQGGDAPLSSTITSPGCGER